MQNLKDKKGKISSLEKKLNDSLNEKEIIQNEYKRLKILNSNTKLISEKNATVQQQRYEDIVKIFQSEVKRLENILNEKNNDYEDISTRYNILIDDYEQLKKYKVSLALTNQ
jgi:hypothetical protein